MSSKKMQDSLHSRESDIPNSVLYRLQILRFLVFGGISLFISTAVDLGVDTGVLLLSVAAGIYLAGRNLRKGRSFLRVALIHVIAFAIGYSLLNAANYLLTMGSSADPAYDFLLPKYVDKLLVLLLFYGLALISTWGFWTRKLTVAIECIFGSILYVWLLSGHRGYHIDAPKEISSLSWKLGFLQQFYVEPQHIFIAAGALFLLLLAVYLFLAGQRPLFGQVNSIRSFGPRSIAPMVVIPLLLLFSLYHYASYLNSNYAVDLSRVSNGVGSKEDAKSGESNLGFHSAVSPTKQPAALVRLETDYQNNPWKPMLYLREGALSAYNGKEIVRAEAKYDRDVPNIGVGVPYVATEDVNNEGREKVIQSIFLLTKHGAPFAVDHPIRIAMIKNPYPERFKLAYQAISMSPVTPASLLLGSEVGAADWSPETWAHYLRAPGSQNKSEFEKLMESATSEDSYSTPLLDSAGEDFRYRIMAEDLAGEYTDPMQKAQAIIDFLSTESIYTRSPGHQVAENGDPVSAYLFAEEKRGYCVHFAHAAVYLMRSLGIPARIATGYLTDTTYAKDGHILLHLGDRHAWPELYIRGQGWVVLDITPEQAENEQALVPDENLLDDLMSKLNPYEELLDPIPLDPADSTSNPVLQHLLSSQTLLWVIALLLFAGLLIKLTLRYGYLLAASREQRLRMAYIAFASRMADIGLERKVGETRKEYAQRLAEEAQVDAKQLTGLYEFITYADSHAHLTQIEIDKSLDSALKSLQSSRAWVFRAIGFLSPLSLARVRTW
jgi:hypothetical protein